MPTRTVFRAANHGKWELAVEGLVDRCMHAADREATPALLKIMVSGELGWRDNAYGRSLDHIWTTGGPSRTPGRAFTQAAGWDALKRMAVDSGES